MLESGQGCAKERGDRMTLALFLLCFLNSRTLTLLNELLGRLRAKEMNLTATKINNAGDAAWQ